MKSLNKKGVLSKRSWLLIVFLVIIIICYIITSMRHNKTLDISIEDIQSKVISNINNTNYINCNIISIKEENKNVTSNTSKYVYLSKDKSLNNYFAIDNLNDSYNNLIWCRNNNGYDVYITENDINTFCKTYMNEEPISLDLWSLLNDVTKYSLYEGTYKFEDTECYVLCFYGTDDNSNLYEEEIYISCDTFLPIALISSCQLKSDNNVTIENGIETNSIIDYTMLYYLDYTNIKEDIPIPEEYICEDEYIKLLESRSDINEN